MERSFKKAIKAKFPGPYYSIKYAFKYFNVFLRHIVLREHLKTRDDLPFLLNILGLAGPDSKGAEIGTWKGYYSAHILETSQLSVLYSIDPWKHFSDHVYMDADNVPQAEFESIYGHAKKMLGTFGQRSQIIRMGSMDASRTIEDSALDFVYIDANHSYAKCREDLERWWPKLKNGGLFAGHDYLDGDLPEGKFGVKSAVNEFVKRYPHKLYVTPETWPTWYFIK